ncbi:Zn-dependent exopeptidase M28 [Methanoculleus sp. FWC-SCC1]|uniref:Zn-dependent exopeptidase M28 n=1 Tax=Methanoculleus frigidifontis TaxID=2584085 RepID=A0ABT8MDP2_9EURY|nr:M28 family metallopeptidase [Methanoculleus sp. FWC-SCC1]MDN7026063.1 Zn-dependent exopeptidase M28 [Methanoculleus sp. FWC-SCC1]
MPSHDHLQTRICLIGAAIVLILLISAAASASDTGQPGWDPEVAAMIAEVSESELYATTADLQAFGTRAIGTDGNTEAAAYLHDRLRAIPELEVEYQGGDRRNVVATLPGSGQNADTFVVVGAHYDSTATDPKNAPGATDNAAGVAIVLELARIMSSQTFDRTIAFALWNAEEAGRHGSRDYARRAAADDREILLYLNYDSTAYDPENRSVVTVLADARAAGVARAMAQYPARYGIDVTLVSESGVPISDHVSFREQGYPVVMMHAPRPGWPMHTPDDTIDYVSFPYARKSAQLGLAVLAEVACLNGTVTGDEAQVSASRTAVAVFPHLIADLERLTRPPLRGIPTGSSGCPDMQGL